MNTAYSPVLELVRRGLEEAIEALSTGRRDAACAAFAQVRPVLAGRAVCSVLDRLLASEEPVHKAGDHLYCAGAECDLDLLRRAHAIVQEALPGETPLVLIHIDELSGGARHVGELAGLSVISLPPAAADLETFVHELVHAFIASGHRMLDEGLAEWLAVLAASSGPQEARAKLAARAAAGPAIETLSARRWADQPCFEGLAVPLGSAHAVAALTVADYAERHGMPALLTLMRRVDAEQIEDIRTLIGAPSAGPVLSPLHPDERMRLRRQFRIGDVSGAADRLPDARSRHLANPDDADLEEDYLILLLLTSDAPDAVALRAEFDTALQRYINQQGDTPMAFALCVSREGLNIRYAPDFIALNDSVQRGRALVEAALDMFENDLDVVATAAKFELFTPLEYGGSIARARAYLQRARMLADDPVLASHLEAVITRLADKRDVA